MRRLCALAILLVFCAACHRQPSVHREPGLNILLITVDTLRADAIGEATPSINRLAHSGVRFDAAHAHNVITLPSHANILSGLYPTHHGVHENSGFRFPAELETLATRLKSLGYRTGAFVSAFPLDRRFGLARGFDVYDDRYGKGRDVSAFHVAERSGVETVAAARMWMASAGSPWFVWVHVYEPHFPYVPPEPFASRFQSSPYLGEVASADSALAPIIDPVVAEGSAGRTFVVLTGDHGESLGEHGETTHGLFAYEATLHVPLIMTAPRLFGPRVISASVRHVDIAPTVLDAIDAPPLPQADGRSLLEAAHGREPAAAASYFESLSATLNRGWAPLYGVLRGSMKYVDLPIPELYDLAADPREEHNLAAARAVNAYAIDDLQKLLRGFRAAERPTARVAENTETRERLRSLGYTSGAAPAKTRFTEADDPKRLVAVDREIETVVSRYQRGDLGGAIGAAEAIQRERPDMPIALVHLAFLYNQSGRADAAATTILRALALNPTSDETAALAGSYLTEAGRAREAVDRLAPYVSRDDADADVLVSYGVALANSGRTRDALAAFERARAADPTSALPATNIGTVYLQEGDTIQANVSFMEALRVDPGFARAHNGLGVIAARRGDFLSAIEHWKRAAESDPHDFQTLYNLGDLLIRLGRLTEARPYWERYVREAPSATERADIVRVRRWLAQH